MTRERMSKTDELMLLGDGIGARKNMLKQVRRIRTHSNRTMQSLDAADRQWPDEGAAERADMRRLCEVTIMKCDAMELSLLRDLAEEEEEEET